MKITRRDILVVLYILSIVCLFLVYNFIVSPALEEIDAAEIQNADLQSKVTTLEIKFDHKGEMEKEITELEEEISRIVDDYPTNISKEDIVLYVNELNSKVNMNVKNVTFTEPSPIYTVYGNGEASKYAMSLQEISVTVDYITDYDGFKEIVNYINDDPERREINSVNVDVSIEETEESLDENGNVIQQESQEEPKQIISGSFSLSLYYIDGKITDSEESSRYEKPSVEHGVDNIYKGNESKN